MSPAQNSFAATCTGLKLPPEAGGTVQGLQKFLNARGFGPLAVDGNCGFATFNAWSKWNAASMRVDSTATNGATPPSAPYPSPKPAEAKTPPIIVPPSPAPVPIWKKKYFWHVTIAGVVLLWFLRPRRRS